MAERQALTTRSRTRRYASAVASVAALVSLVAGAATDAAAQSRPTEDDKIEVVQRKPFLRKGRVELTPRFGSTVNDALIQQFEVGGALTYHINEFIWASGNFRWFDLGELGGVTDAYNLVLEETSSAPDLVEMKWYGGLDVGIVPLYGKFALFNAGIVFYDVSVFVGGGYATHVTGQTNGEAGAPAGSVGIQPRIFLGDWIALTAEVRNTIFPAEVLGGSAITQIVTFAGGVSIFVPFTFEYTTAR